MPQVQPRRRKTLGSPLQSTPRLDQAEVEVFLWFLFGQVAQRPAPLRLRETAGVVRYLRVLARKGVPRSVTRKGETAFDEYYDSDACKEGRKARTVLEQLAMVIWGFLGQYGLIRPCSKDMALAFLRRHSKTYLAGHPLLEEALDLVENLEIAPRQPNEPDSFKPPNFISRSLIVQGAGAPRFPDDLSERIYAGFHILRRSKVRKARDRIAEALDKAAVQRRRPDSPWTYTAVNERVKEYENRQRKKLHKAHGKESVGKLIKVWRERLVYKWIDSFRSSTKGQQQGTPVQGRPQPRMA